MNVDGGEGAPNLRSDPALVKAHTLKAVYGHDRVLDLALLLERAGRPRNKRC